MATTQEQLQTAYNYIRDQRLYEAREILLSVIKQDSQNADAWWLLANAQTDPTAKRDALQILLKIRPDHQPAQEMLARMDKPGDFAFADMGPASLNQMPSGFSTGYSPMPVRRRNPFMFACLVVTGLIFLSCFAAVAFGAVAISQLANNPTLQAAFGTVAGALSLPETFPENAKILGDVQSNQPVTGGPLQPFTYVAYSYQAKEGETVRIQVTGPTSKNQALFFFGLYDPAGKKLAGNGISDLVSTLVPSGTKVAGPDPFQSLNYTFTSVGTYKILISGLSSNMKFTLSVTSGS